VLDNIKQWMPFLKDTSGVQKNYATTSTKRLTIATSNKSFKCNYVFAPNEGFVITDKSKVSAQTSKPNDTELSPTAKSEDELLKNTIFLRVYGKGSDLLVDRQHELNMIKLFSELGVGPRLYATFDNGYVTEYLKRKNA